jgi:hypothetical protein
MESKIVDRPVIRFQLNMPSEVRAQLEAYVGATNERSYPAKLTMSDVVIAATLAYLKAQGWEMPSLTPPPAPAEAVTR